MISLESGSNGSLGPVIQGWVFTWRAVALLVLSALVWVVWARRGPDFGIPVAVGFARPALRTCFPGVGSWLSRRRVVDAVMWGGYVASVELWFSVWRIPTMSAPQAITIAGLCAVTAAITDRWADRRKARKKALAERKTVLGALATDLRLVHARAADAETARPSELDRAAQLERG